ncbi:MAG: glycerol-3-phosphate dehydrogenase/oxidase [Deltaproteobacteria bacterium]|nr:glycerol-3-phosphate dehydrogenase/oxidase [Deltaproteobacteria bacterium]
MTETIKDIKKNWDLIIIGGGITGAGIFRETVRMDLNVLLVEQQDFAWGTSSRSSKLVHGGLRYLKEGKIFLTRDSIKERERLLKEAPGLVESLGFWVPVYKDRGPGKWTLEAGLSIYDVIAKKRQHKFYDVQEFVKLVPHIDQKGLTGAFHFFDAQVDDARLVLRLITEAIKSGGHALNYTLLETIDRNDQGQVVGVTIKDVETNETKVLSTSAVINATGCWAEKLHPSPKKNLHLRPLRGGHMIFPARVLPVDQAVSFIHPSDNRAVFMFPWEGAVIVGTTDLDHKEDLSIEPVITEEEVSYLTEGLHAVFPSLDISPKDCLSTIAGVRPVLSEGKLDPSQESREHVVWVDKGLVTITGGKLTTFRTLAFDALKAAKPFLPPVELPDAVEPGFTQSSMIPKQDLGLSPETWRNLLGRYGEHANDLVKEAALQDLKNIPGTRTLWAELPYAAKNENVRHLADLLLRRVRIGLLTPNGGREYLGRVRKLVAPVLPWDRKRWKKEISDYLDQWEYAHSIPGVKPEYNGKVKTLYNNVSSGIKKLFNLKS